MTNICTTCGQSFAKATGLSRHMTRKNPCRAPAVAVPVAVATEPFRASSTRFNKELAKETRASEGIYFTPRKVRELLFSRLGELGITAPARILEPSFGTGEFVLDARERYPGATVVGVEKNTQLYTAAVATGATLHNADFLTWSDGTQYDLIIGNPPYFVMNTDAMTPREKRDFAAANAVCMTGRPNIYVRFIYDCLSRHLADDGYLAFVLPTSFYNCAYYQPMRSYIAENATVCCLENVDRPGFHDTTQETMLMIVRKRADPVRPYFFDAGGSLYMTPHYEALRSLVAGTTTLRALGFGVKTGSVVWNQVKEKLVATAGAGAKLLLYASNISGGVMTVSPTGIVGTGGEKKQYVKDLDKPTLSGPVILADRGYGNSYTFNAVRVDLHDFYAENHVNVIYSRGGVDAAVGIQRIMTSFADARTARFIEMFVGNGSVSATELETVLPIF
jgi:adenine-specific DNA-methyltransferase